MTSPAETLGQLRSAWENVVRPSARRAAWAFVFGAIFGGAHLARLGTPVARAAAGALLALALVVVTGRAVLARRVRADVRRIVRRTVSSVDANLGAATLRAIALVERTEADDTSGSPALAAVHLRRLVARVSPAALVQRAGRVAARWSVVGVALALAGFAAVAIEPFRIVEGVDVLVAEAGEAPLPLDWLEEVEMSAAPPEYLHETGGPFLRFSPTSVPRGTVVTVRGRPVRRGRPIVLTDGNVDVPFVDDGSGAAVARWNVADSTSLFIAARFGEVRVRQADEQRVTSIPDELPKVIVEGAPRTVKLIDEPSISIHFEASDDHGLREVDLVLRSAGKEERRVLSRPAADAKSDRGGYEVKSTDAFLKKTFAPTSITVEARDNDMVSGPKWGKSEVILVVPPEVGEPEALRYAALLAARGLLTDLLADRLEQKAPTPATAAEHVKHEDEAQLVAVRAIEKAMTTSWGGLSLRGRFPMLARGQLRRLRKALDAEQKSRTPAAHAKLLEETESVLLAFDAGVRGLGVHDAQTVSKRLADVAEDVASALASSEEGDRGTTKARVDASISVLEGGGRQLLRLGELGRDLGEIVGNGLRRIDGPRSAGDVFHTELAARDLAARLRRPDPSFMGGGGRPGVESGGSPGGEGGEASEADREAASAMQELEQLARDHQNELDGVQQVLESAGSPEEIERFKQEAKEHAEAIRKAVKNLPNQGGDPSSAESAAAEGRDEAEAMAGALERGAAAEAVDRGKRSVQSLAEAKRLADQSRGFFPEQRAGREAAAARETLERELAWVEEMRDQLRRAASARSKGALEEHAKNEEKLEERAKAVTKKGEAGEGAMPQEMLDHVEQAQRKMQEAEKALREGDGQRGVEHQKDAQRHLEMAQNERQEEAQRQERAERDGGKGPGKAEIPDKKKHKGPEEFRRRVLEGLGGSADPLLREAVKRYAEGLLK